MNEVKWKESLLLNDNQKRKPKQYERIHERYMAFLQVYVLAKVKLINKKVGIVTQRGYVVVLSFNHFGQINYFCIFAN